MPLAERDTLAWVVLGEQRDFLVHLPGSCHDAPERRYPVAFVLDGSSQDLHTAAYAALMARIGVGGGRREMTDGRLRENVAGWRRAACRQRTGERA